MSIRSLNARPRYDKRAYHTLSHLQVDTLVLFTDEATDLSSTSPDWRVQLAWSVNKELRKQNDLDLITFVQPYRESPKTQN